MLATAEERQARDAAVAAAAAATWKAEEQRLALEAAQKAEEERFSALPFSARISQSSKEAYVSNDAGRTITHATWYGLA